MDTLTIVLLVVIAAISLLQTTFLVRLWMEGRRTLSGLETLANRLVRDLTPAMRDVSRAAVNAGQVTESALLEMQKLDAVAQEAAESWSGLTSRLHEAIVPTVGRVALVAAAWRVVRRGRAIYRWLRR
jgi:hypothetical protein